MSTPVYDNELGITVSIVGGGSVRVGIQEYGPRVEWDLNRDEAISVGQALIAAGSQCPPIDWDKAKELIDPIPEWPDDAEIDSWGLPDLYDE